MLDRRNTLVLLASTVILPRHALSKEEARPVELRDGLAKHFADEGTAGVFAAYDPDTQTTIVSNDARARDAILPASTYKIPNSVIALDTGVVQDPDKDIFKWDGTVYALKDWNKGHTLRTAIAASAVPVYQEIARRIGQTRMQDYVNKFDYGNRNIGGGIDHFWLTGDMRISPLEEIVFVDKLRRGVLPVSQRAQDLTRDILPQTKVGDSVIRAKSGLIGVDEQTARNGITTSVGWLVGYAEKGSRQTVFALNLDIRDPKHIAARVPLAQKMLAEIGAV